MFPFPFMDWTALARIKMLKAFDAQSIAHNFMNSIVPPITSADVIS
jgi:hypothetical protein